MQIKIDGNQASREYNYRHKGQGMISCNGSSRLLMDYREKNPEAYWKILELCFGENGLNFSHLKIEMGSDVNTSSGTEPTVMRYADEKADVRRGAGFRLAADVKTINPQVTLDMLWWSEPRWVSDATDVYAERYRWYKETLISACNTYGLVFDYVSANRNENEVDDRWIVYLSKRLKAEKECPYDFSKIKIVAADECHGFSISGKMLLNPELMEAVDIVGAHYISFADDNTRLLAEKHEKEIWFSEGSAPMNCAESTYRFDEGNSGISGLNGALDIANRMITMVSKGYMTMYEYQPAISAYYDGVTYCHKRLIDASCPWSGFYVLDSGFYMQIHFSMFIKKGWSFILPACFADGAEGGDGHCITAATYSYITACSDEGDYSVIITNTTAQPITYDLNVLNLAKTESEVYVWETRGPETNQRFDHNYFRKKKKITPVNGTYSVTVEPYSLVTVSTLDIGNPLFKGPEEAENEILQLPFVLETDMSDELLEARGGAPFYTTDQGGAFEIVPYGDEKVIMQKITPEIKAEEWGYTPAPVTTFGDDRWYNYSISAQVLIEPESYAGVGLRYMLVEEFVSGYALHLDYSGCYRLLDGEKVVESGIIPEFDNKVWHKLKLSAEGRKITGWIDEQPINWLISECGGHGAGRGALYSSYSSCCFKNIVLEPSEKAAYVKKFDNLSEIVTYSENGWEHLTMSSFRNYKRTVSNGTKGASLCIDFKGPGIVLTGGQNGEKIRVSVDENASTEYDIPKMDSRRVFLQLEGLEDGEHRLRLEVIEGTISLDSIQVYCQ